MPKKPKNAPKQTSKSKRTRHTVEQIQSLLQKISAARASGTALMKAVKEAGIHYNTYRTWARMYSTAKATAATATATAKGNVKRIGSATRAGQLLDQIAALRDAGMSQVQALQKVGLSMSTYRYWLNKQAGKVASAAKQVQKGTVGVDKNASVVTILEEMTLNRKQRAALEKVAKEIQTLDVRFEELRKKLGA